MATIGWTRVKGWSAAGALAMALALAVPAYGQGVQCGLIPAQQSVALGAELDIELDVTAAGAAFNGFDAVLSYDPAAPTLLPTSPTTLQQGCLMTGGCSAACGNTFHRFAAAGDSVAITDILLCDQIVLSGPGPLYKLHFRAANVEQVTTVRIRRAVFYDAGLYVTPVATADCQVGIGIALDVGGGGVARGLKVSAAPNPARSGVAVRVESAGEGEQEVGVYDVNGRRVRELSRGWYGSGARVVGWDGRDGAGARVAAGVYLVRFRAGGRIVQTRVTLLQ